jgi:hypothetical protein
MKCSLVCLCTCALSALTVFFGSAIAEASYTPILPPSYPLAVRNPYLSGKLPKELLLESSDFSLAWLPGNEVANLPSAVARFYNGQQLTWSVMARIDGKTYSLFGVPHPGDNIRPGNLVSADFSATHTTFSVTAAEINFVLDFFSPVSTHNYARQSMPFSYLTGYTSSPNSETPSVQIYSDMDNAWVGQFGNDVQLKWDWARSQAATEVFTLSQVGTATFSEDQEMSL